MKREEFARYMRSARERVGLSKFAAGKALGYISDGTINGIEQGRSTLPVEQIHPIARLYGISIEELLDKIKECEPRLFARYQRLYRDIVGDFASHVAAQRSNGVSADRASHHSEFCDGIVSEFTYNTSYQKLVNPIAVQMELNLRERNLHNDRQKVLVFRHAGHPRTQRLHLPRNLNHHELRPAA